MPFDGNRLSTLPALIVPGWQNSGETHWQTRWQHQFGWQRIEQKEWQNPNPLDWAKTILAAVENQKKPPYLICHSLGCIAVALAAQKNPSLNISGAFLVAPPDLTQKDTPVEIRDFAPTPLHRLPFASTLIASTNDPFCSLSHAEFLSRHWGSELVNVGPRHHIGSLANLEEWEEGQRHLNRFARR